MVQTERSKELLLDILKPCFFDFDEWPTELIEGAIAQNMDPSETLENIFRFRTLLLNFLQMCPYQLIDKVYFAQVINSVCSGIASMHASTIQTLLRSIITNNLTAIFIKAQFGGDVAFVPNGLVNALREKCTI